MQKLGTITRIAVDRTHPDNFDVRILLADNTVILLSASKAELDAEKLAVDKQVVALLEDDMQDGQKCRFLLLSPDKIEA